MGELMKGMGFGLLLAVAMNYIGMVPVIGPMLAAYSFYVIILLIVLFLWMGFRD